MIICLNDKQEYLVKGFLLEGAVKYEELKVSIPEIHFL